LAGQQALEVGVGRNVGLEILDWLGAARVTGFDLDPQMVKLAEARLEAHGDGARVFIGDADAIEARNAAYDTIVEYGMSDDDPRTLNHVPVRIGLAWPGQPKPAKT